MVSVQIMSIFVSPPMNGSHICKTLARVTQARAHYCDAVHVRSPGRGACQPVDDSSDCPRTWKALRESLIVKPVARSLLLIALVHCVPAHADSVQVLTGSIGGTSDFVFRGLSLTRGKPAAQASIDVEFPKEFYVGAFARHLRSESRAEPGGGNRRLGRALLAPLGPVLGRRAPVAVHLPGRSAPRHLQPHRDHRHARLSQSAVRRGYLLTQHARPWRHRPATTKATPGRSNCRAVIRSTSATPFPRVSAITTCRTSTTTPTTTGMSR